MMTWLRTFLMACILSLSTGAFAEHQTYLYSEVSESDYKTIFLNSLKGSRDEIRSNPLDANDNRKVRVDTLIEELERAARLHVVPAARDLPPVRSVIIPDPKFIAFQSSIDRCVDIETSWGSRDHSGVQVPSFVLNSEIGLSLQNVPSRCVHQTLSSADTRRLILWINENYFDRGRTQCRLDLQSPPSQIRLSSECDPFDLASHGIVGAKSFNFPVMMNAITLSLGFFDFLNNETLEKAVIAHELAHYYLAHSLKRQHHSYFYDLREEVPGMPPQRRKELDQLGQLARFANVSIAGEKRRDPQQKFSDLTYSILRGLIDQTCGSKREACAASCAAVKPILSSTLADYRQSFRHIDGAALACGRDTLLTRKFEPTRRASLSGAEIESMFSNNSSFLFSRICIGDLPSFETLEELLIHIDSRLREPLCQPAFVLKEAEKNHLGYFTSEQEADLVAIKILKAAGQDASRLAEVMLKFAEDQGDPDCRKWEASQKGNAVPLLKDYSDPHHDSCFRAHYIKRVIESI